MNKNKNKTHKQKPINVIIKMKMKTKVHLVKFAITKTMTKWMNVVNVKNGYSMNAPTYHLIWYAV